MMRCTIRFIKRIVVLTFTSGMLVSATGQTKEKPHHYLSGHIYGGQFQVLSQKTEHFRGANPFGVGIDYVWKFVSQEAYSLCRCYPSLGSSLNYWYFGHDAMGNGISALFYLAPVLFSPGSASVSLKAGLGFTYLDNPYHEKSNPQNVTYSTAFSFPLMAGLSLLYPVNKFWGLRMSGMYQHISNGGVHKPNLGIDYITVGFGVQRKLDDRALPEPDAPLPFSPQSAERQVSGSFVSGFKETDDRNGEAFVHSLSGEYLHQFARIHAWSAGGIWEIDNSHSGNLFNEQSRVSLLTGHSFLLGRFAFAQKAGIYLWSGHPLEEKWFQYYSLDFEMVPGIINVGVGLKAHEKVAEYLSLRLIFAPEIFRLRER